MSTNKILKRKAVVNMLMFTKSYDRDYKKYTIKHQKLYNRNDITAAYGIYDAPGLAGAGLK